VPFIGNWLSSVGAVIGDPINCERMLDNEEAIIVFPEGVRGSNKLYKQRYQLQRFGSGFVHLAMNNNAPIIPVGIVGMEETIRSYADLKPLAKLLGMPVLPLVVPFIFPSKVFIYFGKPIYFNNDVHKESDIKERVDIVKAAIDDLLKQGLARREEYQRAQKEKNKKV
jgi:1-acyl-sn-glycerol-3-phosphate acyltransferase